MHHDRLMTCMIFEERAASGEPACCDRAMLVETDRGEIVCGNCGTCFGYHVATDMRRAYTPEEMRGRCTHEAVPELLAGPRTVFNITVDWAGRKLSGNRACYFARLSKINRSITSSDERNHVEAMPYMKKRASDIRASKPAFELAWRVYVKAQRKRIIAGRSIRACVNASLFIACRVHGISRHVDEFMDGFSRRLFNRTLQLIVARVLPGMNLKLKNVNMNALVDYVGNKLHVTVPVKTAAVGLMERVASAGIVSSGKDPKGIAAAAIYIAARACLEPRTQDEVARAGSITEVTLRARVKEMKMLAGIP